MASPTSWRRSSARTLGVPIFQEQAMKIALDAAQVLARPRPTSCARRWRPSAAAGRSICSRTRWSGGWSTRGYDRDFAERCFHQIRGFGEYGFPESHAASFAHLVYVSSWIKWRYPAAFAAALLNCAADGLLRPGADRARCAGAWGGGARGGCEFERVGLHAGTSAASGADVRASEVEPRCATPSTRSANGRGLLRLGLRQVDGLRARRGLALVAARGARPFADVEDLRHRARIGVATIQRLAAADAFRSMGLDRRQALWDARALKQAPDLPLFLAAEARDEGAEAVAATLPAMPLSRACGERLPDRAAEPESASDARSCAIIMRSAGSSPPTSCASLRYGQRVSLAGPGPHPPAPGQRQGRVLHHAGGRDGDRQPRRLARPLRGAAQRRHGRAADGRPRRGPA